MSLSHNSSARPRKSLLSQFCRHNCTAIPLQLYGENDNEIFRFLTLIFFSSIQLTGTIITFTESSKLFGKKRLNPTSFLKQKHTQY